MLSSSLHVDSTLLEIESVETHSQLNVEEVGRGQLVLPSIHKRFNELLCPAIGKGRGTDGGKRVK